MTQEKRSLVRLSEGTFAESRGVIVVRVPCFPSGNLVDGELDRQVHLTGSDESIIDAVIDNDTNGEVLDVEEDLLKVYDLVRAYKANPTEENKNLLFAAVKDA